METVPFPLIRYNRSSRYSFHFLLVRHDTSLGRTTVWETSLATIWTTIWQFIKTSAHAVAFPTCYFVLLISQPLQGQLHGQSQGQSQLESIPTFTDSALYRPNVNAQVKVGLPTAYPTNSDRLIVQPQVQLGASRTNNDPTLGSDEGVGMPPHTNEQEDVA